MLFMAGIIGVVGICLSEGSYIQIGLTLDAAGFSLLWGYGLPSNFVPDGNISETSWDVNHHPEEKARADIAKYVSYLAVLLVVLGFIVQFYSNI